MCNNEQQDSSDLARFPATKTVLWIPSLWTLSCSTEPIELGIARVEIHPRLGIVLVAGNNHGAWRTINYQFHCRCNVFFSVWETLPADQTQFFDAEFSLGARRPEYQIVDDWQYSIWHGTPKYMESTPEYRLVHSFLFSGRFESWKQRKKKESAACSNTILVWYSFPSWALREKAKSTVPYSTVSEGKILTRLDLQLDEIPFSIRLKSWTLDKDKSNSASGRL
jgi:hypothetical protein